MFKITERVSKTLKTPIVTKRKPFKRNLGSLEGPIKIIKGLDSEVLLFKLKESKLQNPIRLSKLKPQKKWKSISR